MIRSMEIKLTLSKNKTDISEMGVNFEVKINPCRFSCKQATSFKQ